MQEVAVEANQDERICLRTSRRQCAFGGAFANTQRYQGLHRLNQQRLGKHYDRFHVRYERFQTVFHSPLRHPPIVIGLRLIVASDGS
jgi:hypothetical protein